MNTKAQSGIPNRAAESFAQLRHAIVAPLEASPVQPRRCVLEDQIIWGRSPVRLDLAGGWTDTPPYCIDHGGQVVNLAADLNGQPPIQVFARLIDSHELVMRSIDLGVGERLTSYDDVADFMKLGSGFSIARAAFALAGFHPRFNGGAYETLEEQLRAMGGGIEISLLAAVPKGSGLGTSSVLASTLLSTLSDFCGLGWSHDNVFRRTLALEQLLTSGGGWQDQIGGLEHGVKLIKTAPGVEQNPVVRWLPERLFSGDYANGLIMLYYTGITRVAHNILGEIVRNVFSGNVDTLECLDQISRNAGVVQDAIQRQDWDAFTHGISRSWELNQKLDPGTNPPAIRALLSNIQEQLAAVKLLGAGGGGYLLMLAKDVDAARCIRRKLNDVPPNSRARFVNFSLSQTGLQITRS
jgi:galactokinase/mevalonate kinase-like predicted kinase